MCGASPHTPSSKNIVFRGSLINHYNTFVYDLSTELGEFVYYYEKSAVFCQSEIRVVYFYGKLLLRHCHLGICAIML